jgi:hypothetical protein
MREIWVRGTCTPQTVSSLQYVFGGGFRICLQIRCRGQVVLPVLQGGDYLQSADLDHGHPE